jgi:A/G-specific adenine glycosylase
VLVSEVMLQQTQVHRVLPKYLQFMSAFPTAQVCAGAPLGDLLTIWQGLGYPRRCRHLHEAAKLVVERHGGTVPDELDALLALPGVGDYTARAVMAFADHRDVAVVDTNIARVLARLTNEPLGKARVQALADSLVPSGRSWEWNQALMDLGATVCTARSPKCDECPIGVRCGWKTTGGPDPAPGSALTSKPQARFEGSDRQARGRLMKTLVSNGVRRDDAAAVMGLGDDSRRAESLVQALLNEGLVVQVNDHLTLP